MIQNRDVEFGVDRAAVGRGKGWETGHRRGGRKVRAPEDRVVGNAHRPQGPGQCNRK